MTTEKKEASNRRNAKKSTGPRSAAGKAVVSQNARKHGVLSHHLIIEGESQEEFLELLNLLVDEFQPVGLVEHALVDRVGIALWRQRRLVRAEAAEVSLNQQCFGVQQREKIGQILGFGEAVYSNIKSPADDSEEADIEILADQRKMWQSLLDAKVAETDDPFSHLSDEWKTRLLEEFGVEASRIDTFVEEKCGSWTEMFEAQIERLEFLIRNPRIPEVRRLVLQSQALPTKTDLLARYQTALDNDLYKALKALREVQIWRQARAVITVTPILPDGSGISE